MSEKLEKKNFEIEKKFLVRIPDFSNISLIKTLAIKQTYLEDGKKNAVKTQRRVRKTVCGSDMVMTYTEKVFISPVIREENEREIDIEEYQNLITQAKDTAPVIKTRKVFLYENQVFEMDIYPFSDEYAILEIELNTPEQKIYFPDYIDIVKEVTSDKKYSNLSLASAGKFPKI